MQGQEIISKEKNPKVAYEYTAKVGKLRSLFAGIARK